MKRKYNKIDGRRRKERSKVKRSQSKRSQSKRNTINKREAILEMPRWKTLRVFGCCGYLRRKSKARDEPKECNRFNVRKNDEKRRNEEQNHCKSQGKRSKDENITKTETHKSEQERRPPRNDLLENLARVGMRGFFRRTKTATIVSQSKPRLKARYKYSYLGSVGVQGRNTDALHQLVVHVSRVRVHLGKHLYSHIRYQRVIAESEAREARGGAKLVGGEGWEDVGGGVEYGYSVSYMVVVVLP